MRSVILIWVVFGLITAVHLVVDVLLFWHLHSLDQTNPYTKYPLLFGLVVGACILAVCAIALLTRAVWKLEEQGRWFSEREELRLALDAGEMGTWSLDFSSNSLHWDAQQFQLFGILPDEFRGEVFQALTVIHPEDLARVEQANQHSKQNGVPFREEFRVVHPDGTIRWLVGLGRPLKDAKGKLVRMIGVNFDVTTRKQTEAALLQATNHLESEVAQRTQELAASTDRLRAILDNAVSAIITIDENGIIRSASRASERLFGYRIAELLGQNVSILMPSPYREEHDGYIRRYLETGQGRIMGQRRELVAQRKDDSVIEIELAINRVDHLNLFIGNIQDITRKKELEREVVEIAAMEQQRIGQDLHDDVGQQLTALGLLASSLEESLAEQANENLDIARKVHVGIRQVLRQVRSISQGLVQSQLGPDDLVPALVELTTRLGETSGVQCRFQTDAVPKNLGRVLNTHLFHIAQEACTNALKHSRASRIDVRLHVLGEAVRLQIEDNGIGISPSNAAGLGRKIMRNRASVIGATLTCEPATPNGTVITCLLPLES